MIRTQERVIPHSHELMVASLSQITSYEVHLFMAY